MKTKDEDDHCFCERFAEKPATFDEIKKRCSEVSENTLKPFLSIVKTAKSGWHVLYKCKICGRYWADEYPFGEEQGGGSPLFYVISAEDPVFHWEREIGWAYRVRQAHALLQKQKKDFK